MNAPIIAYRANMGVQTTAPFANTYSLDFDGVDDYVNLGRITAMEGATNFSFSMWIYPTSYTGLRLLFGKFSSATDFFYAYTSNSFGYIFWHIADGQTNYPRVSTTSRIDLNTWGLLTFVYDGSLVGNLNKAKIYINGTLALTTTTAFQIPSSISLDTTDFYLAQRNGALSTPTSGKIDEVSAYDYSLSASEVMDIYNLGTPTDLSLLSTPPIHWYRNGDNGSYKSPQWLIPSNENKDKASNYSFEFDGIDDKVELGTQSLGITGAISVSAWVKIPTTNTGGGGTNIQQFVCEDRTSGTNRNWTLNWRGGGLNRISGVIFDSGGTAVAATTNAIVPNDGNWHHVMFTYTGDTSTDGLKLFVDGIQRAQGTSSNGGTRSTTAVVPTIGGLSQTIASMFEGNIDEVSIFNTVVDIADVWNGSGQPIDVSAVSGIVSNYRMGEEATFSGGLWTVPDSVGSNNGTSNAMTIDDRVGEAPNSDNNALSYNMDEVDRVTDVP